MAQLLPAQSTIVNALLAKYQNPELTIQHHLYISGEMGTGKTYMGSAIVAQLKPKHVLIVCPPSMPNKWAQTYLDFVDSETNHPQPVVFKSSMTKNEILQTNILIVVQDKLYGLLKKLYDNSTIAAFETDIKRAINQQNYTTNKLTNYQNEFKHYFDFVICDEVHTYKPTYQVFRSLAILCQTDIKLLGLTGTLFRQNIADLHWLLTITNPEFNDLNYTDDNLRDMSWFYPNIWRYISAPISLHEVELQKAACDNVKQDIMPLKGLTMSDEQKAWYDLVSYNLKRLGVNHKRIDQITTSYLDLPTKTQPTVARTVVDNVVSTNKQPTRIRSKYISGMTLTPIKLADTPKYKQLLDILQQSPDKTIIFVQDTDLGTRLAEHLPRAFTIPSSVKANKVADYVNSRLNTDYDLVIATIKQIQTGIDLNSAHQIIWYQVPGDVTAVLQAQRRVLRLNSTNNSKVWFLYYNETEQETTIKDVSRSATNNAAAYNIRRDDNLTRLTGLLFGDLDAFAEKDEEDA